MARRFTICNMEDRKRALDAKDQGSSYSPPKLSIIDSYTLTLGPLDDNVTVDNGDLSDFVASTDTATSGPGTFALFGYLTTAGLLVFA